MTWADGITCSVLRDVDAVAEVYKTDNALYNFEVECRNGCAIGTYSTMDAAKAAAERAIRTMRGEEEGC